VVDVKMTGVCGTDIEVRRRLIAVLLNPIKRSHLASNACSWWTASSVRDRNAAVAVVWCFPASISPHAHGR
jgi:hypothetical protein